jgi:RNA polymerase sigma-B factor
MNPQEAASRDNEEPEEAVEPAEALEAVDDAAEEATEEAEAETEAEEPARRKLRTSSTDVATPELFAEYGRTRDPKVREKLILAHMNLVRYLARKFANRGEPLEDLIQVGMIGLINAIDRFDPDRGIRFATYATPTIVGEIRRHFRDRGWAVKVPRRLQELSLAASKAMDQLSQQLDRPPTVAEIAESLGVAEEEAMEALELSDLYELPSLDRDMGSDEDDSSGVLADYIGREDAEIERFERRNRLSQALKALPERERQIIELRFFRNLSQTEVAKRMKISQMHVSRLQHRALSRLREYIRE